MGICSTEWVCCSCIFSTCKRLIDIFASVQYNKFQCATYAVTATLLKNTEIWSYITLLQLGDFYMMWYTCVITWLCITSKLNKSHHFVIETARLTIVEVVASSLAVLLITILFITVDPWNNSIIYDYISTFDLSQLGGLLEGFKLHNGIFERFFWIRVNCVNFLFSFKSYTNIASPSWLNFGWFN